MRDFLFDVRYAARTLRLNPGFATVAIVTMALGIGGTAAIFSVLDPVLIRPLPYAEPERLVSVETWWPSMRLEMLASADFADFASQNHLFTAMAAYPHGTDTIKVDAPAGPLRANATRLSPDFFRTLGVQPLMGRGFEEHESHPEPARVAIISFGLWQRAFGADPGVVGRRITLDDQPYTLIGILPARFRFPEEEGYKVDVFTPLPMDDARLQHGPNMMTWRAIGRLKPGATLEQARADLETVFARIRGQYKWFYRNDVQLRVIPLRVHQVRDVRAGLLILAGAVGFVLLIACANVAHVMLARAAGRAKEIAVRAALGAGRLRLARQLFTESVLIGFAGAALGSLLAFAALRAATHLLPADIPHIDEVSVNSRVLVFAGMVSIGASALFGLAPVLAALRTDLIETLKLGTSGRSGKRGSMRGALLAGEIAFSMVLLAGAALLMESLWRLENVPLGFQPEHLLTVGIPLEGDDTVESGHRQRQYQHDAIERVGRLPGVRTVALADYLPPDGVGAIQTFSREDRPMPEPGHRGDNIIVRDVNQDYFRAMGIPLLQGRVFRDGEIQESLTVVVNQALVRRYFPNEEPLGKRIGGFRPHPQWKTIVGVVADEKNSGLRSDPQPEMYQPFERQHIVEDAWLVIRAGGEPATLAAQVQQELHALDPHRPVTVRTMPELLAELVARPRFQTLMMAIFSALALAMAAVGVYGVASWSVARRTREIGVRMALGAAPGDVSRMVLCAATLPLVVGVGAGTAGALAAGRYLESLLFGVKANDGLTLTAAACLMTATALVATYIPARRAARMNPAVTLRSE